MMHRAVSAIISISHATTARHLSTNNSFYPVFTAISNSAIGASENQNDWCESTPSRATSRSSKLIKPDSSKHFQPVPRCGRKQRRV